MTKDFKFTYSDVQQIQKKLQQDKIQNYHRNMRNAVKRLNQKSINELSGYLSDYKQLCISQGAQFWKSAIPLCVLCGFEDFDANYAAGWKKEMGAALIKVTDKSIKQGNKYKEIWDGFMNNYLGEDFSNLYVRIYEIMMDKIDKGFKQSQQNFNKNGHMKKDAEFIRDMIIPNISYITQICLPVLLNFRDDLFQKIQVDSKEEINDYKTQYGFFNTIKVDIW